jgi:hypothetical protein
MFGIYLEYDLFNEFVSIWKHVLEIFRICTD